MENMAMGRLDLAAIKSSNTPLKAYNDRGIVEKI